MTATGEVNERQARQVAEEAREARWDQPSFGKELFLGRLRLDLVHPHPRGSAETTERGEAFLAELREFCETQIDAAVIERDAQIPDKVIQGLKGLGAFGMKIGVDYEGLGLSQVYYNKALALVGSVHPALGALLSAHQSIGVPQPVSMFGTAEQKQTWLPRCTREISAFLLTEPDVGSDPARLHATATPDGDDYLLNGVKLWTTNGVIADLLVVMAQVPPGEGHRGGITAFVVEADTPGIVVTNRNVFMGLRGIENGLTKLTDVRVPAANRIGREGEGLKIALTTLNVGRLSLPAVCTGTAKWCVKIAREWSKERVQWGRPVGEHDAVAGKVAFIAATAYGIESMVELAGELADAGRTDIRIEAALAKLYGSEMTWLIADELVQIRGGRGFETAESLAARGERGVPVEQVLRDMRINRIFEGSTEIMHLMLAREAVDAHLSVAGDIIDPDADLKHKAKAAAQAGKFYSRWLPTLVTGKGQLPTSFTEFGPLGEHLRYVERASRKLARSTFYAMSRWQGKLEYRQRFLGRIVDIGAELFAMTAACVRARSDTPDSATELADAFCRQARARTDRLFTELWDNSDDSDRTLAHAVLDGRYTWLEDGIIDPSIDGPWIAQEGGEVTEDVHRVIG
ncbi:acyl-CoA dehydrogenase [Mycolicibacterium peregrinum]|uniref:acyl-CoA dehydrogenase family protein n=1 Tax=Mycolicibacterium peregrinum TaxID=43304 RepID=UPI0007EBB7E9|nr:acyl-CoA dehydrogenase family protein [Mycolicibacterium peregrinum]OBF42065.1 acyl-CoA dehydrogenase [Mycolicibacterium peregrinum]